MFAHSKQVTGLAKKSGLPLFPFTFIQFYKVLILIEFVFVSCSSDSTVNVWDLRTSTPERVWQRFSSFVYFKIKTIQVGSNKEVLRPTFSNHINCIDVDNDFMVKLKLLFFFTLTFFIVLITFSFNIVYMIIWAQLVFKFI